MSLDPLQIASRMSKLDASGIRKVFDLAAKLKDPVNFSIGQPDFDVPESIKARAVEAIAQGKNSYTQTQGTAALRTALAEQCKKEFGWADAHERAYLVTSGVSGALHLAVQVMVNPGDEVIFADPYFVMYSHLVNLAGGVPVTVDTYDDFRMDLNKLEAAITPHTRMLILNSPANPTGVVYSREELTAIAQIARKHDLLVISDEIYEYFCYDDPFVSMAGLYEKTLLTRGFSKSHAMTGWRIGWCTGPKAVVEKMTMLQQYTFVCAPSMVQEAALVAMETDMTPYVNEYRKKRDMIYEGLKGKFGLVKPRGAFYAFVPAPGGDAKSFVEKAIANNVLIIPGNVFSSRNTHFRISYATTNEKLAKGIEILNSLA